MNKIHCILSLVLVPATVAAQNWKKEDKLVLANIKQHIQYLADDKLEGRRTGTAGEQLAAAYISSAFANLGLLPTKDGGYAQQFPIADGKQLNPSTHLTIDGKNLKLNQDFFPLVMSPNVSLQAMPSLALQESSMPWFINVKEMLEENVANPHFDLQGKLVDRATEAAKKGATVLFVYNTSAQADGLSFEGRSRAALLPIPIVYITKTAATNYFHDDGATLDINLKIDIGEKTRSGTNVVGFINNSAATTIILGAHYDHLGFGEDGNSREVEKKRQIHNGADDNASGTAALIELARLLKSSAAKKYNYVFIAFSGEELGLYGSKYFTQNPTVDFASVNYMINMDMIGRLNDSSGTVTVGGYGTSPQWGALYAAKGKKKLFSDGLQFRFDSSGTGPSDHTSFYLKNIPVLFFFTGLHTDYHKPTDDFEKINYNGELRLIKHIYSLVTATAAQPEKLVFTKTREAQTTTTARFSVSLGIMPDYTYSGAGVRVDGVSANRAAEKAGIKAGDIITKLGEHAITSMEGYMQTLSKFKKGDKTTAQYIRNGAAASVPVEF